MKKLLLTLSILSAAALVSARFSQQAGQARTALSQYRAEYSHLANRVNDLAALETALRAQIQDKKIGLKQAPAPAAPDADLLSFLSKPQSMDRRETVSPSLRQRLGIGWDNSPDYVLVSKAALKSVWLPGVDPHGALSPTLCEVLALTAEERAAIGAALQRAEAAHAAWFKTAVERVAPSGDIVAEYRVPANPELAKQIRQTEEAPLAEILGPQRLELLENFAGVWLAAHEDLSQQGVRFTVHHTAGRQPPLWYQIEQIGGSSGAGEVQPNSFPDLFRGVFPGGWRELAQRESFELPKDFEPTP